jgi:ATP synthase protein I
MLLTFSAGPLDRVLIELPLTMKKETQRALRELAYYSSLGLQVALSIFIGLFVGVYLDRRFDTAPWLTLIGLAMGIAAGYRNIGLAIKRSRRL